jgi:hypothetical protein
MRNLLRSFALLAILYANDSFANDTLIKFGQNLAGAPQWKYRGGGTNLDAAAWKTLAYTETNWQTGNAALGAGTVAPINTTLPADNSAGGFGPTGGRYSTLYFRKVVNISNLSSYSNIKLNAKFDDGIVVWVNGTEAYRNNVGTGTVNYNTWAAGAIANNGADIYTSNLNNSLFVNGDNIIAVEVHQVNNSSSDLYFDLELIGLDGTASVTRGPYLQSGGQSSITLRWRSDVATNSRVEWGPAFNDYSGGTVDSATLTTEHIVTISGLTPDTKYFYRIGSTGAVHQQATNNYFVTLPTTGTARKLRFAAFGDCGANNTNQVNTKNALLSYLGTNNLDALLTIGDNAYSSGTDAQFQSGFFDIYQNDILRFTKLYTGLGNHDYGNTSANTGVRNNAYYSSFTMPTNGELGGVASGTEAYYSYDIGNVHFIALDSYGRENGNTTKMYDTLGAQAVWLKSDLAANTKRFTIAYFHHPPYTKTSHDSDLETDLQAIREKFIRILERFGVDIVLCGHAHGFERTSLLKNYYTTNGATPGLLDANYVAASHSANTSSGRYNGTANSCAYTYNSGKYNHGSMYIVSGSAGQIGGSAAGYPLNAAVYSNNTQGGSLYIEVDSNRLDAKFISHNGTSAPVLRDSFTIFKDVNKVTNIVIGQNVPLILAASWRGNYNWPNNGGVTTQTVQPSTATVGTFNYIVTDANNCLKDSFNVVVTNVAPVVIENYTATLQKDKVLLNWNTAQEINSDFFSIAKSADGIQFENLESVDAAGNSTSRKSYQLTDYQPFEGVNFYRLSQTDQNGYTKILGTKRVTYNSGKDFTASAIHTGNGNVKLLLNSKKAGDISLRVFDVLGKEVFTEMLAIPQGAYQKNIQLKNGVYVLKLSNLNQQISQKIVIE